MQSSKWECAIPCTIPCPGMLWAPVVPDVLVSLSSELNVLCFHTTLQMTARSLSEMLLVMEHVAGCV